MPSTFFAGHTAQIAFLIYCCILTHSLSQPLDQLALQQQARLEKAVERLRILRQEIYEQQIPFGQTLEDLQKEAASLRGQLREERNLIDRNAVSLSQLGTQVAAEQEELNYISDSLLSEFESSFKASLSTGEQATFGEELRQLDLKLEQTEAVDGEHLFSSLEMLQRALDRVERLLRGKRYPGLALTPDGKQLSGDFIQLGPLLYFGSSDNDTAGWVEETQSLRPKVRAIDAPDLQAIQRFIKKGEGLLPLDPTLGDAIAILETNESWREHLEKGGVWVVPILSFAIISTIVAVYKCKQVFLIRPPKPLVVQQIIECLNTGHINQAHVIASSEPGPVASMLNEGIKHSDQSIELVEEVMFESILGAQPKLERFLNVIAVTAATAPLLGLLGTVTGIIKTFKMMEIFGAGDPKPLISGISEALITTELGLILAIPTLITHALLSRRVKEILSQMEKISIAFVNGLARQEAGVKTSSL